MSSYINETTYNTDPKFQGLRNAGVSYEDFSRDPDYYLSKLSKTSIMDLHAKGQKLYEHYTELYYQQDNIFIQLEKQKTKKAVKYNELLTYYANNNGTGEPTTADKRSAVLHSGYTTDLINSVTDAEIMKNVYLSGRQNAVDMQRKGLMG